MLAIYILLIIMIIGAIIAIEVEDLLSSVVTVGAVGLGLSLVCLVLKAPDVAITQFVVEIIALIILMRATVSKDVHGSTIGRRLLGSMVVVGFIAVFLLVAMKSIEELPAFGEPTMRISGEYLASGMSKTGAANMVSAILLDFRAYDTLGEATVLFTAVIGVLAVVRRIGRKEKHGIPGREDE